jgi:hypothetical protein
MMRNRPRLKAVLAILLVWQVTAVGYAFEIATVSGIPPSAIMPHCASHAPGNAAMHAAAVSGHVPASDRCHAAPKCCAGNSACSGSCVQGATVVVAQAVGLGEVATGNAAMSELRARPELRRPDEVFRPPI